MNAYSAAGKTLLSNDGEASECLELVHALVDDYIVEVGEYQFFEYESTTNSRYRITSRILNSQTQKHVFATGIFISVQSDTRLVLTSEKEIRQPTLQGQFVSVLKTKSLTVKKRNARMACQHF